MPNRFTSAIKTIIRRTCLALGGFMLFIIVLGFVAGMVTEGKMALPSDMILVMNITDPIGETEHGRTLTDPLAAPGTTVQTFIETLDAAAMDRHSASPPITQRTGQARRGGQLPSTSARSGTAGEGTATTHATGISRCSNRRISRSSRTSSSSSSRLSSSSSGGSGSGSG